MAGGFVAQAHRCDPAFGGCTSYTKVACTPACLSQDDIYIRNNIERYNCINALIHMAKQDLLQSWLP